MRLEGADGRHDVVADDGGVAPDRFFITLARRPDVIRDPGALFWLMTVVKNACLRMLRSLLRRRPSLGEDSAGVPTSQPDPEAALARWRLVHLVHRAIASLERPYREILVLRDLEGQTGDEVCAALGLSPAAMKSRLHRARSMIREQLSVWSAGDGKN
jgi:RNA polymerase sigma-70 factor (ECF subfamily)